MASASVGRSGWYTRLTQPFPPPLPSDPGGLQAASGWSTPATRISPAREPSTEYQTSRIPSGP
jgi:hypothetical protein